MSLIIYLIHQTQEFFQEEERTAFPRLKLLRKKKHKCSWMLDKVMEQNVSHVVLLSAELLTLTINVDNGRSI